MLIKQHLFSGYNDMEIWDLYNEKREIIGEHIRGNELSEDAYHLVVHIWILNSDGKYLISQRSASRTSFPLMWETVGGSVLKGETSLQGAIREVKEEVGIELDENDGMLAFSKVRKRINGIKFNDILDVWVFKYNGIVDLNNALTHEVEQTKWLCRNEVLDLLANREMVDSLNYFKSKFIIKADWLFFDLGSTLIDESECYKNRIDEITSSNSIDRSEFETEVLKCARDNAFAIKTAAKAYGVDVPPWKCELERLYPDTKAVLQKLAQKYNLGIIANQEAGTKGRLESWGIRDYFKVIIASTEAGCSKPGLQIFRIALDKAGCKPQNAVMIGDRLDNDIIPVKELGMKTIWVKQGYTKYQPQSDIPDFTIDSISQLIDIL